MKILLRPWSLDDVAQLTEIANNRNIWNTLRDGIPHPYSETHAVEFIDKASDQQPLQHYCIDMDGKVAGCIGVKLFDDVNRLNIEIGYYIAQAQWGKGLGTESVRQFVPYIFETFNVIRIFANVFEKNLPSMRVLEKNGFHLECIHKKSIIKNNIILDEYVWVRFNPRFRQ